MSYITDILIDKKWSAPKSLNAFSIFFSCKDNRHLCFHICIPAHGVISFLTLQSNMSKKRNTESSEADYQTASSADLGDGGMLFWLTVCIT